METVLRGLRHRVLQPAHALVAGPDVVAVLLFETVSSCRDRRYCAAWDAMCGFEQAHAQVHALVEQGEDSGHEAAAVRTKSCLVISTVATPTRSNLIYRGGNS